MQYMYACMQQLHNINFNSKPSNQFGGVDETNIVLSVEVLRATSATPFEKTTAAAALELCEGIRWNLVEGVLKSSNQIFEEFSW